MSDHGDRGKGCGKELGKKGAMLALLLVIVFLVRR